ncbi:MAG: hypothetical protein GY774_35380 [Planctomycetes bacterium]|nr:hypothetical protein [Planctomycetota bacterium]
MALTKVTLSGAVNTIKEAWTKFNDLIDDLLSTSNGLGASTIGIEDSAGNMAATNVEAALAEIYTDTSSAQTLAAGFDENSATTTGLTWGYKAGTIRVDNVVTSVAASTIGLTDDSENYVELNQSGTMTKNTTAFTTGYIPVRQLTVASGIQTVSTDKRAWFIAIPDATTTQEGVVELATDAETQTGTDTARAITPANLTARTATTTRAGIAELATDVETKAGTDTNRIVRVSGLTDSLCNARGFPRAQFEYKDADEIYINPCVYRHEGTTTQAVYTNSQLTYTFSSLENSDWSYLYIDDSDLVSDATNVLTAARLTESTTEPTYNASKQGWYSVSAANDRCIFAVLTDGSGNIKEFFHDGNYVLFADEINNYGADLDTSWVDVTLSLPKFSTSGEATFYATAGGAGARAIAYWRVNGQTGATGHRVGLSGNSAVTDEMVNTVRVMTDASQIIEVKHDASAENQLYVYTNGWYLPLSV